MLPSEALRHEFTDRTRQKAAPYTNDETVQIVAGSADEVTATVQGTERYLVHIARQRRGQRVEFAVFCTCPYYVDGLEPCKHIWATLVVAEQHGHLLGGDEPPLQDARLRKTTSGGARQAPSAAQASPPPPSPFAVLQRHVQQRLASRGGPPPFPAADGSVLYVLDPWTPLPNGAVLLQVMHRRRLKSGGQSKPTSLKLSAADVVNAPPVDRRVLAVLFGAERDSGYYGGWYSSVASSSSFRVSVALGAELLPSLGRQGRLWWKTGTGQIDPLPWDEGPPWRFRVTLEHADVELRLAGEIVRGEDVLPATAVQARLGGGFLIVRGALGRVEESGADLFLDPLRESGAIPVTPAEKPSLVALVAESGAPAEAVPEALRIIDVSPAPVATLTIDEPAFHTAPRLPARLSFDYDGVLVTALEGGRGVFDADRQRFIRRDLEAERAAAARLTSLNVLADPWHRGTLTVPVREFAAIVTTLTAEGWRVVANGRRYRSSPSVSLSVSSGIDWFDLSGTVRFDDEAVPLAVALEALKARRHVVVLGDGSLGLLPEAWLARFGPIVAAGETDGEHVRFRAPQAALLDALLASREQEAAVEMDETFARVRRELASFGDVRAIDPPASFTGTLRRYQAEGLGWFAFLRRFGFGGCLADDMGLGKTVMVLALLDARRLAMQGDEAPRRPSLVVVPRSLIANWLAEAARFTPALCVLDHSHAARDADAAAAIGQHDVALVTYGTLRRDIATLSAIPFDYVVLDEAQAIKNATTASAKAARLLVARHRLALSGTPVENHLGELWSLFEFLNPGVLGRSAVFQRAATALGNGGDPETAQVLSRGLRPFVLRRTKAQVATDLPPRTEQTIVCELSGKERSVYDSLRQHYRRSVLARVERVGLSKAKMHVLEALLRLRQAACHVGLVHPMRHAEGSAKFDVLLPRLGEVMREGHKAIVFSQFTSLLGLLRAELERAGVPYEYLDGQTRDRAARVQRFQQDPDVAVFLVSLKAGGVGLNLTAAEYVFLLDPWWNPAVEAQAIDRAHRIGQTREVFAYRLVAKDTIEEKILQLQQSKRALADAVLAADAVGLRHLDRASIELLLS